ncbi:hypothetical protein LOD99_14134 [Oopsacas minuta]|uniref:Uncharacterized protein n=1 Tax=Oopsacas minuta TaxID=111878 RepID=A0AAV7KIK9_9METZ|nr:hypothetical protein LOD99_14134 [Oopsacas minuta]
MMLTMAAIKLISDSLSSKNDQSLIIPSHLEPLTNAPLFEEGFVSFNLDSVADLYTTSPHVLQFSYTEKGVAYGQQETSSKTIKCEVPLAVQPVTFVLNLTNEPVYRSGVNYAAVVQVSHQSGLKFQLLIPGTRTYDPAGISGDPHCSERVGNACSSAILKVVYVSLVAALKGASIEGINQIFSAFLPINETYHGRIVIMQYMQHQLNSALFQIKEPQDYPDFIKELDLQLTGGREHTKSYLNSATKNSLLQPPRQYYKKVQDKDKDINELLSAADYQRLLQLV